MCYRSKSTLRSRLGAEIRTSVGIFDRNDGRYERFSVILCL